MDTNSKKSPKSATKKSNMSFSDSGDNSKLQEFFIEELKDILWAEKHLSKALPKFAKASTSPELKAAFDEHLTATEEQIARLEQVFTALGKKAVAKKCDAMEGLVKEANSIIEDTEKGTMVRDVALIFAAQKAEHYEIATYGCLKTIARILGHDEVATLLETTLEEEKTTDVNLTVIAESFVNEAALAE